jgi:hypothetical protein
LDGKIWDEMPEAGKNIGKTAFYAPKIDKLAAKR